MRSVVFLFALLALMASFAADATAEVRLFDFEDASVLSDATVISSGGTEVSVSDAWSSSGRKALRVFSPAYRVPSDKCTVVWLPVKTFDWRPYDRIVFDVYVAKTGQANAFQPSLTFTAADARAASDYYCRGQRMSAQIPVQGVRRTTATIRSDWVLTDPAGVTKVAISFGRPDFDYEIFVDNVRLLKKGEQDAAAAYPFSEFVRKDDEIARLGTALELERMRADHHECLDRFRAASHAAGTDRDGLLVGLSDTMTRIRPRAAFACEPAVRARVRLARGETEGFQVVLAADGRDAADVEVAVETGDPEVKATVSVVGYVEAKERMYYADLFPQDAGSLLGWWPDPLLHYVKRTDVKAGDVRSFWVSLTASRKARAGERTGRVTVRARGSASREIPLVVRVNDFEVPVRSPLPLAVTFMPEASHTVLTPAEAKKIYADPEAPVNVWKRHEDEWTDFLADRYVTMDSLYLREVGYPRALERLKAQGRLGEFNLGYWNYVAKDDPDGVKWRAENLPRFRKGVETAKRLGALDRAYIYGCDEVTPDLLPRVRTALDALKEAFPGVKILTTAFDHDFGCGTPLAPMDAFCPLTPKYDRAKASAARKEGREVWWYICCNPPPPHANGFLQSPAIDLRLLMGAMTAKERPDGFLYYEITMWCATRPLGTEPFTDWEAKSYSTFHGDGSWTYVGPDGIPVSSIRFENFRDGLEDFAYVKLLESLGGEAKVPETLVKDLAHYSKDPKELSRWREALADEIERLKRNRNE